MEYGAYLRTVQFFIVGSLPGLFDKLGGGCNAHVCRDEQFLQFFPDILVYFLAVKEAYRSSEPGIMGAF